MEMREEEKIFAGILFNPGDPELKAIKLRSHKLSAAYSRTDGRSFAVSEHAAQHSSQSSSASCAYQSAFARVAHSASAKHQASAQ